MNTADQVYSEQPDQSEDLQSPNTAIINDISEPSNDSGPADVNARGLNNELATKWLAWQCQMIADVITGVVYNTEGKVLAMLPETGSGTDKLAAAGQQAYEKNQPIITTEISYGANNGRLGDIIATPIKHSDHTIGYVAVLLKPRQQSRQNAVLQLLQWGGFWLQMLSQLSDGVQIEAGAFTQSLLNSVLNHSNSNKACMEAAARISDRLNCDRVSIGLKQGVLTKLECISHIASFDPRTQLVRRLEAAMEECLDQNSLITLPKADSRTTTIDKAHKDFAANHSENSVVASFPMHGREGFGVITLERPASNPFDSDTIRWCQSVIDAVAPVIELQRFEERSIITKARDSSRSTLSGLMGPSHLKLKAAGAAAAITLLLASIFNGNHTVSAPAQIEGAETQIVAAPVAGFIKSSEARAGDEIKQGDILATLDDRSLQLELKKWQGESNKIKKSYQEALAKKARTELSILRARSEQIEAELSLVQEQLDRTKLKAPYDGYVISGDLSQSLGAPVEIGDVLFEVAPIQEYKVVVKVDEKDMAGMDNDKAGKVVIAAMPGDPLPIDVEKVIPMAISGDGNSYFRVEATLTEGVRDDLRPGMEGVARLDMGDRKLIWIWTHKLVDKISLWFWSNGW